METAPRRETRPAIRPPVALAAALAALAAFAGFYALGRVTAGTTSGLMTAKPFALDRAAPHVPVLGAAEPLPPPPRVARRRARAAVHSTPVVAAPPAPVVRVRPAARLVSGSAVGPAGFASTNIGCARWASPSGNDSAAGTAAAPFRTITRLAASLHPGQNGCLAPGSTFVENVRIWNAGTSARPIKIVTEGSPRATIRGSVAVSWRAHDVVLAALTVERADASAVAAVTIHGARAKLVRVEVSGSWPDRAGRACVRIQKASSVVLDGVEIHGCTRAAAAPGVLVLDARGTRIENSFVYDVAGAGVALGRGATHARLEHDIVDGNHGGIAIDGSRNRITKSIVADSASWNVQGSVPASGNVVSSNCLWQGGRGELYGRGLVASHNLVADPRFRDRAQSLALDRGPCFSKRPQPIDLATTDMGTPWPRLPGIAVHWTVQIHGGGVHVDSLSFARLAPGASYTLRCVQGCAVSERLPSSGSLLEASVLDGRQLPAAAVVELRERRAGAVGTVARLTVGGKHGLRVSYACLPPLGGGPVECSRYRVTP